MPPSSPGRSGFTIRTAARLSHNKQGFPMTVSLLSATVSLGRRQPVHDQFGKLALRHGSRLHHLGIGRHHAGTPVLILVATQTSPSSAKPATISSLATRPPPRKITGATTEKPR